MIDFKIKHLHKLLSQKSTHESKNVASDVIDRLHSQYTGFLLFIFISILGAKCYIGNPIDCIVPKEYSREWSKYITNYCFVRGTYNFYGEHYDDQQINQENFIGYYQWVPIFLLFQIFCFALPSLLWLVLQNCFYIDVQTIVSESAEIASTQLNKREEKIDKVSEYIFFYFYYRNFSKKGLLSRFWRLPYIFSCSYLLVKLMFLINVIVQLLLVCYLINAEPMWGVRELKNTIIRDIYDPVGEGISKKTLHTSSASSTSNSYYFPTVVRCKVQTTQWGLIGAENNIQCLLSINHINEKVFFILYYWYSLLTLITVANILDYLIGWMSRTKRNNLVKSVLKAQTADSLTQQRVLPAARKLVDDFLGMDGVLLLHFVHSASNATLHQDVAAHIWKKYCGLKGITFLTRPSVSKYGSSNLLSRQNILFRSFTSFRKLFNYLGEDRRASRQSMMNVRYKSASVEKGDDFDPTAPDQETGQVKGRVM